MGEKSERWQWWHVTNMHWSSEASNRKATPVNFLTRFVFQETKYYYRFIKKTWIASTDIVRKFLLLAPEGRFYSTPIMKKYLQILIKVPCQGFIQAAIQMSVFWAKIEFSNIVKCRWGSQARQRIHSRALVRVYRVKLLNDFGLFTSEGQVKNLE